MEPSFFGNMDMKVFEVLLTSLFTIIFAAMLYMSYKYVCSKVLCAVRNHDKTTYAEEARYNKELDRILYEIYHNTGASNVTLFRFHNGGTWANGHSMKKFSAIMEKFGAGPSLTSNFKDILCSHYPEMLDALFFYGVYRQHDMAMCKDTSFRIDMEKLGIQSVLAVLIRRPTIGAEEAAFVMVSYTKPAVVKQEQNDFIQNKRSEILALLDQTKKV